MNLIKLFGVSALVLGLAACGEADKAASTEDTGHATEAAVTEAVTDVQETATEVVEAVKAEAQTSAERVKSKFDTQKFEGGASGDVSSAPAPAFAISDNLGENEYINSNGELVTMKAVEDVKENDKLRQIPEGMKPGSVEHTMWLLDQPEDPE